MSDKKKPEIRFPEFTDDWEQRKFSDVTDEFQSGKFIAAADIEDTGEYPVYGGNGLRGYCNTYNHDGEFALIGRQGALCGNMNFSCGKAYFTEHAVAVKANSSSNTRFLYYLLDKMNLGQYSDQSAQPGLAVGKLVKLENMFPSKAEQDKIGSFLVTLDNLITLHQRKIDKLKDFKRGCLQKLFPYNGTDVPEVRFPGFTGAWKQRKLKDIVKEFYNGQTPYRQNKSFWNGNINWLSSGDLNRGIVTKTIEKITEEGMCASRLRVIPKGTFVIAVMGLEASGTRGNCGILGIDTTINQACMALIVDEESFSSKFLFQWYQYYGDYYALKYCQGTKQQNYNAELLGDLDISYPTLDEQVKISQYFDKIDNLITLYQLELGKYKEMKRGLLQKIFI